MLDLLIAASLGAVAHHLILGRRSARAIREANTIVRAQRDYDHWQWREELAALRAANERRTLKLQRMIHYLETRLLNSSPPVQSGMETRKVVEDARSQAKEAESRGSNTGLAAGRDIAGG